jgi:hypothetical protein
MVEKLKYTEVVTVSDDTPDDIKEALDKYFSSFISLEEVCKDKNTNQTCYSCQSDLTGIFGTFQFGLVYGEGGCSKCLWPCRSIHHLIDNQGKEIGIIRNFVLQYHPDLVERKS